MVVWRPRRVNFGSSLSSVFLHIARIKFVAKMVKTPEALASVIDLTFVDDEIFYGQSPEELKKVQEEICAAYNMYSFEIKHVFLSTDSQTRTQFLALDWIINKKDGSCGEGVDCCHSFRLSLPDLHSKRLEGCLLHAADPK